MDLKVQSMAAGVDLAVLGADAFRAGVALWLDQGSSAVDAELRADLENRPAKGRSAFSPGEVVGAPGEALGFFGVHRGRRTRGGRVDAGTIGSFAGAVDGDVDMVSLTLRRLDAEGRAVAPRDCGAWVWDVSRIARGGEVLRLHVQATGGSLLLLEDGPQGDAARAGLAALVRRAAVSAPLLFAFAGPCGEEGETVWEARYHLPSHAALRPGPYRYRGLGWVTALPDWAVAAAGGLDGLARLPLHSVEPLDGGGAWLVATEDLRQAGPELLVGLSDQLIALVRGDDWMSQGPPTWQ